MTPRQMENWGSKQLNYLCKTTVLNRREFIPNSKAKHLISTLSFYTSTSQGHPRTVKFKCLPLREFGKAYICSEYLIYSSYDQCPLPNLTKQLPCRKVWNRTQKWHGKHPWQLGFHFRRPTRMFPALAPLVLMLKHIFSKEQHSKLCSKQAR